MPRPASLWDGYLDWLTLRQNATISFSLLRLIFGAAMLIVLLPSLPDRHYLWGVGSWWVEPEASRRGWWEPLRWVFSKESVFWFDVSYGVLIALVLIFIAGWKTRWITPVLLLFWVGLSTNSTLLSNGGDTLMRIVLLFVVFANLSEHFSVDAWLRRRRVKASARERRFVVPAWLVNSAHNTVLLLCLFQILLVYAASSFLKLAGEEWLDGTALYYALSIDQFRLFPALSDVVWQFAPAVVIGTWVAFWVQLLFPLMVIWRPTRYVAVVLITGMHLGIAVLLGLWPFSLAMIAIDLLFVRDGSWRRAAAAVRRGGTALAGAYRAGAARRDEAERPADPVDAAPPDAAREG